MPGAEDRLRAAMPTGFGALLRAHRLRLRLTQEALAERAGLGSRSIQHLERGESRPQRQTVHLLAGALALSPAERTAFEAAAYRTTAEKTQRS